MSSLQRNELNTIRNSRLIRAAVYDAAIMIGAFLAADRVYEVWPEHAHAAYIPAFGMLLYALIHRCWDDTSLKRIDAALERDDEARRTTIE
jgi:hypothetical protein